MNMKLETLIRERLGRNASVASVVKLHGDASYRTYSRVFLSDGSTLIAMQMPAGAASASEEITNFKGKHAELPFINVARYLGGKGLPVPKIEVYDEESRLMLLEDLGDDLMARRVESADDETRLLWYRRAIDLLTELQSKTAESEPRECVALERSFDGVLLDWEFDHFLEYCVEARLGVSMGEADRALFIKETRRLSAAIGDLPKGFTHRDFQSRNLIVRNDSLMMIDFQDALIGPQVYDLVALLRDSYVKLSEPLLGRLVDYYAERASRPVAEVRREFDMVTVQRKLKDAGRFVYIDRVKKNPGFLKFIPASLGYVKSALERMPNERPLFELLKKYLPEWKRGLQYE